MNRLGRLLGPQLAALFRATLGAVFVVASLDKIASPAAFARSIANYRMVPDNLINLMAIGLPFVEIAAGIALLLGVLTRPSLLVVEALLAVFIVAIAVARHRGLDISCGCFTTDPHAHRMTDWTLIWDTLWLGMGVHALLLDRGVLSLGAVIARTRDRRTNAP
jgi:putative oxidoreductase